MKHFYTLIFFMVLMIQVASRAEAQQEDFNLWAELELKTHLSKRFDMVVELSNRWHENASRRSATLAEVSLEYGKKWFSSGLGYRFENKSDLETGYIYGHRLFAFVSLEAKSGRFTVGLRNKFQTQYFAINSSEDGKIPSSHDRTRIKIDYNIRKIPLKPYLAYELFSKVNSYETNFIEKNRIAAGLDYKLNSRNKLGLSFFYDRESGLGNPDIDYILLAGWTFELN